MPSAKSDAGSFFAPESSPGGPPLLFRRLADGVHRVLGDLDLVGVRLEDPPVEGGVRADDARQGAQIPCRAPVARLDALLNGHLLETVRSRLVPPDAAEQEQRHAGMAAVAALRPVRRRQLDGAEPRPEAAAPVAVQDEERLPATGALHGQFASVHGPEGQVLVHQHQDLGDDAGEALLLEQRVEAHDEFVDGEAVVFDTDAEGG